MGENESGETMDLIKYLRMKGYRDIRIVSIKKKSMKLIVDGWIVDVKKKGCLVFVRAYVVNPRIAADVWEFFAEP